MKLDRVNVGHAQRQAGRLAGIGRQAGRRAGRQIGRRAGRQIGRQAGRQIGRWAGRQICRQAGRQAGRQIGRQAGRQADRQQYKGFMPGVQPSMRSERSSRHAHVRPSWQV